MFSKSSILFYRQMMSHYPKNILRRVYILLLTLFAICNSAMATEPWLVLSDNGTHLTFYNGNIDETDWNREKYDEDAIIIDYSDFVEWSIGKTGMANSSFFEATKKVSLNRRFDEDLFDRDKIKKVTFDSSCIQYEGFPGENISGWFIYMSNLEVIEGWEYFDTSAVAYMSGLFGDCSSLTSLDLSHFDTSTVITMDRMFWGCSSLTTLDLSHFDTSNVTEMWMMFSGCSSLTSLDLRNFDISEVDWETWGLLSGCIGLKELWLSASMGEDQLSDDAFEGVGTEDSPCILHFPDGLYNNPDDSVPFYLKGGWFCTLRYRPREAYAALDNNTLTFYYDDQKGERDGEIFEINATSWEPKWLSQRNYIHKVVFDESFIIVEPSSTSKWFHGCKNLTAIEHIDYLITDWVSSMDYMFADCEQLKNLDLSHFYTSNVKDMKFMFYKCHGLENIDLNGFDTSSVTNMKYMFYGDSCLSSVDLNMFDTHDVTTFVGMFSNCTSLEKLDLSTLIIGASAETSEMLSGCSGLRELKANTQMELLNEDACKGVGAPETPCLLTVPETFIFGSDPTDDFFQWKSGYFCISQEMRDNIIDPESYLVIADKGTTVTLYHDNLKRTRNGEDIINLSESYDPINSIVGTVDPSSKVTKIIFDSSFARLRPKSTAYWFNNMHNLQAIEGLEYLNTSETENMEGMFQSCLSLTHLDLRHFDTSKVKNMNWMFYSCNHLESLDLSHFSIENCMGYDEEYDEEDDWFCEGEYHNNTHQLLTKCNSLKYLTLSESMSNIIGVYYFHYEEYENEDGEILIESEEEPLPCIGVGSPDNPCYLVVPDGFHFGDVINPDGFAWSGGYFRLATPYASLSEDGTTQTLYFDNKKSERPEIVILDDGYEGLKAEKAKGVAKVVVDPSFANARPNSTYNWFKGMSNLTAIEGLENINTSTVNSMRMMFNGCNRLTSIDLSHFNTSNVRDMYGMFYNCRSLTSLDLSSFNTSKVDNMYNMFYNCNRLAHLDLGHFDTSNVEDMRYMFKSCTSITALNLSHFNTAKVKNMLGMFSDCNSLAVLDLSSFDTSNVESMSMMFQNCYELTSLDLSNFNTKKVRSMSEMFELCSNLKVLDVGSFDTSKVTDMSFMFEGCSSLTSLDLSHFTTSKVKNMCFMFYDCNKLASLELTNFDTSMVTNMRSMFNRCSELRNIDLSHFDTYMVESMYCMFEKCTALESLDVSHFDTSNLNQDDGISCDSLFMDCTSLRQLRISPTMYNLGEGACYNVGTVARPCQIIAPDGFDFGTETKNGVFEWKAGFFIQTDDGINLPIADSDNRPFYNLQGMPVSTPRRGVYIQNGRKVMVR